MHCLKTQSSITVTVEGIEICFNDEHPENAFLPIEKTDGIAICMSNEQSLNDDSPIDVNDERIDTLESDLHPSKTESPMVVTKYGMTICSSDEQSLNAESPIDSSDDGSEI